MSATPTQTNSTQTNAHDLLSKLVDQISHEPKPGTSKQARVHTRSNGSNSSSSTVFHSSNDSNGSTEYIRNIIDDQPEYNFSTSTVLHYCKRSVLLPYQRFLIMLGWRPIVPTDDAGIFIKLGVGLYTLLVMFFTILSYILQYAACFRRDIVPSYEVVNTQEVNETLKFMVRCKGTLASTYLIPDSLQLFAYIYMYYLIRIRENEQLQVLMERVFLQAFYTRSSYSFQPKVVRTLRLFLGLTLGWIGLSISVQICHVTAELPNFTWMKPQNDAVKTSLIVLLILTALWTDLIHVAIVASYGIQCQLLISFIRGLCERVREKSLSLEEAIKEIGESAKILKYLNEDFAVSIALTMVHAGLMSVSGLIWAGTLLSSIHELRHKTIIVILVNSLCIILWTSSFIFPLIQAARLSAACHCIEKLGLYIMTRPFGYQDVPLTTLQPFLCYTSSLKLQAKLFRVPIKPWVLFALGTAFGCILLILTQLNIIKLGV